MGLRLFYFILFIAISTSISGQIVINEVLSSNDNGIVDEDQDYDDWIELYNSSIDTINLEGYILDDNLTDTTGWVFPGITIDPQSFILVFASGKDRKDISVKSKTIINEGDNWKYIIPPDSMANGDWRRSDFNDSDWLTGQSGFGYGDNDDNTIIQPLESIYIRKEFTIDKLSEIKNITLHVDFDDAFIAFINGVPVASENVDVSESDYDNIEVTGGHEAVLYNGGIPTGYEVDIDAVNLVEGINVIALQGYNTSEGSTDFTLIPFLTIESSAYNINDVADFIDLDGGGNLHSDFKISKDGESLYLYNAQHELIDSINVVPLITDVSYGRYADGSDNWFYFPVPTPGEANLNPIEELRNDTVYFSIPAGFYSQTNQLSLSSSANDVVINYTSDGTEPTYLSQIYSDSISLAQTQVIKAAAFIADVKSGETYTQTYFINTSHQLPVIALSTDPKNFFDWDEGILVEGPNAESDVPYQGANYWMDWEKAVIVEYFDEEGLLQLKQGAGVKVAGNWSRANDQKSMALYARSQYGKGSFKYKFFKDRSTDSFESILLRNSGGDWRSTMLRDGLSSELAKDLNMERLAFQPTVVYLNGDYWGILNMREKPSEHYFASLSGLDSESINMLEQNGTVINGVSKRYKQMISFITNRELYTAENYQRVADVIDVDCYIDYELFQIFINNTDWPGNNIKFWNTTSPHSQYRWLLFDTDFGFSGTGYNEFRENTIEFATDEDETSWPNPAWSTLLLRKMLTNDNYKNQFINRLADIINVYLNTENMTAKLDSMVSVVASEMPDHKERWGFSSDSWNGALKAVYNFINLRQDYVYTHFSDYFNLNGTVQVTLSVSDEDHGQIQVSTITPSTYPFNGTYFTDVPIIFTAKPKPGCEFVRWEDASTSTNKSISLTLTSNTSLRAIFKEASEESNDIVINEINYISSDEYDSGDWIELYNNGTSTVDISGWYVVGGDETNSYIIPEGNVLYPRGFLVLCRNLSKFQVVYPEVKNKVGEFSFGVSSSGDQIELYSSEDQLIDYVLFSTTPPWPVDLLSTSSTLGLMSPYFNNNDFASWTGGVDGGTPGAKNGSFTSKEVVENTYLTANCFPTKFTNYTTLSFSGKENNAYIIKIIDILGNVQNTIQGQFDEDDTYYLDIFTDAWRYAPGVYLVVVQSGLKLETIKVMKY